MKQWKESISVAKAELYALRKQKEDSLPLSTNKRQDSVCEEPIIILPPLTDSSQPTDLGTDVPPSPPEQPQSCDMEACFELQHCSLLQALSVHVPQGALQRTAHSKTNHLVVEHMYSHLRVRGILSNEPSQSCVSIVFLTDNNSNSDNGSDSISDSDALHGSELSANVVVIDWRVRGTPVHGAEPHETRSTSRSIAVSSSFSGHSFRQGYDIVTPLPVYNLSSGYWRHMKPLLPVEREFLLYFQGVWSEGRTLHPQPASPPLDQLMLLQNALGGKVNLSTECDTFGGIPKGPVGWQLCGHQEQRVSGYSSAIFSLVPATGISPAVYTRLVEALRWGSIPVVVGRGIPLPFDDIIDWHHSAVVVPLGQFNEIHYILKSFRPESIMEMKRRCRFLFYFI